MDIDRSIVGWMLLCIIGCWSLGCKSSDDQMNEPDEPDSAVEDDSSTPDSTYDDAAQPPSNGEGNRVHDDAEIDDAGESDAPLFTDDGDPSTPVVEIDGLACGPADGMNTPPVSIGGRDVLVHYPCEKRHGAKMTYILVLHGTQDAEVLKTYQHAYLGAFQYTDSHNIIVTSPKSVVAQWGNGDDGQDEPHLMEVIEWVYETFSQFDITSMWIAGHSWGSAFTRVFCCREELRDKVKGVILQSGAPEFPECADRLSIISTAGEFDLEGLTIHDQTEIAAQHGCDEGHTYDLGANQITEWSNCDPGWVHKSYLMLGKEHGFDPADWPDEGMTRDIADAVKSIE